MFYDDIETRAPKTMIHRDRQEDRIIDPFVSTVLFDSEHLSFRYSRPPPHRCSYYTSHCRMAGVLILVTHKIDDPLLQFGY